MTKSVTNIKSLKYFNIILYLFIIILCINHTSNAIKEKYEVGEVVDHGCFVWLSKGIQNLIFENPSPLAHITSVSTGALELEKNVTTEQSLSHAAWEEMANETIYQFCYLLEPPDIINLIRVSRRFLFLRQSDFWKAYNRNRNRLPWSSQIPAQRVAFSYYWYENYYVRKAAAYGLPCACERLKKQNMVKKRRESKVIKNSYSIPIMISRKIRY